jgi:magnesium chelatase subunit I
MTPVDHEIVTAAEPVFPFSALVGQERLTLALLLAAVDPGMGGVLVLGPRGTAKSTAARALADILPDGAPFVDLPLSASLEQLVGTLDLEAALQQHSVRLRPGVLARAHGGVLYVDEVNLLPDALVDALLDVAASGVNVVERDGLSVRHAARFILVGTMNPEEGSLRPQLLDRFALAVQLDNPVDGALRARIVQTRLAFEADPQAFVAQHAAAQAALRERLRRARARLPELVWDEAIVRAAAGRALAMGADGVRGDLALLKAARAHAAWRDGAAIELSDLEAVAELALAHRASTAGGHGVHPPTPSPEALAHTPPAPPAGQRPDGGGSPASDGSDWGWMPPPSGAAILSVREEAWPLKKA